MRALLADDERLARVALRRLLKAHSDVEVVSEAANANEVLSQVHRLQPDVLFLDVQMPGCSGLELLERMEDPPPVIFTTAYENYAVRAFDVSAVDYLVKPIVAERLASALNKIRGLMEGKIAGARYAQRVFLREGDHCWIAPVNKIRLFESEGNYTGPFWGKPGHDQQVSLSTGGEARPRHILSCQPLTNRESAANQRAATSAGRSPAVNSL